MSRVAFVSHLLGLPLCIVATFDPSGACRIVVHPHAGRSVPLLSPLERGVIEAEARDRATCTDTRFAFAA